MTYEYKVVPAPIKGQKAKGLKTTADRFANALELVMNEQARAGWDYVRADTLPCEEREGLMGKTTVFQNMLVFRRAASETSAADTPTTSASDAETFSHRIEPAIAPVAAATVAATTEPEDDDTNSDPETAAQDDNAADEKSETAS